MCLSTSHQEESSWIRMSFSLSFATMDLENSLSLFAEDGRREAMSSNGLGDGEDTFWRMRALEVGVETPFTSMRV